MPELEGADRRNEPRVSVVIPAYNCEEYVGEAIDSVLAQTCEDYEIVVVDDAATDGTAEVLRRYEEAGEIRMVRHERNRGLAAARNSGIRASRGEFVSFLDADDLWRPEALEHFLAAFEANPDLMFLSNDSIWFQDGEEPRFPDLPEEPELRHYTWRELVLGASPFSASNAMVRRECLEEVGLFDENLRAAEDRELWIRIARRFGTTQLEGRVSAYRRHGNNMTADPEHMKRNMERVYGKVFADTPDSFVLKRRAYAWVYLDVAVVSHQAGRRRSAFKHLLKSALAWPLPMGWQAKNRPLARWMWAVKIALGRERFQHWWEALRRLLGRSPSPKGAAT